MDHLYTQLPPDRVTFVAVTVWPDYVFRWFMIARQVCRQAIITRPGAAIGLPKCQENDLDVHEEVALPPVPVFRRLSDQAA